MGRRTVTSVVSLGRRRDYAVLGAAPELAALALRELPPDQRTLLGCLEHQPASAFATAFRDLQGALASSQIVAFIAGRAGEGASTIAVCTANAAAQQGRRVMLLDCDPRGRSFSRALDPAPTTGLTDACASPENWRSFVGESGALHYLAAARSRSVPVADAPGFALLLEHLRDAYDFIVLDCPPALGGGGAAVARMADFGVLVAAWDETPISSVRACMLLLRTDAANNNIGANIGLFVNRVPPGHRFGRLRPD